MSGKLFIISMIFEGIASIFLIISFFSKKHALQFKERGIFLATFGFVCFVIDNFIITVALFEQGIFDEIFVACIIQYIVAIVLLILSIRLKKHALKLCKQNLQLK